MIKKRNCNKMINGNTGMNAQELKNARKEAHKIFKNKKHFLNHSWNK
jgi:hypothetical protein